MWIGINLLAVMTSIVIMLLIAKKWNIANRSTVMNATIISLGASLPFLWINYHYESGCPLFISVPCQIALSLMIALTLILYHFLRDPERNVPQETGVIVSPADGEVIYIKSSPDGFTPIVTKNNRDYCLSELAGIEFAEKGMLIIGIEMNILNVHINRCPIEGHVRLVKYIDGKFISLREKEAPFVNARCTTLIMNETLTVAIVQIASRLVRRVDNYLNLDQNVILGQRLGMIRFGSQVAAILPDREDIKIEVSIGQKVIAGTSVLASYREKGCDFQQQKFNDVEYTLGI